MIGGYADNVVNPGANKRLSKARTNSVRRELMRMGVAFSLPRNMASKGDL